MNKAVVIVAAILISGCTSVKRVASGSWTEASVATQTECHLSEAEATLRHEEKSTEVTQTITQSGGEVTIVTEVFDTSRPADPATGHSPLMERTTEKRSLAAVSRQCTETERQAAVSGSAGISERSESRATVETDSRAEVAAEERRGAGKLIYWLAAAGATGILYGLYKIFNTLKKFFI